MRALRPLVLIGIGGLIYAMIELVFRGRTHWTMLIVGGLCFWLIGLVNEVMPWEVVFWKQCLLGSLIVTVVEFFSGCIINLGLGWNVWDYSNLPLNLLGQICLPFSLLWILISAVAVVLDDYLRYWLYGEEKPHYTWI